MNLSDLKARRAALVSPVYREICRRCRKARPTCYCHMLRPFQSPVPFVILQHADEARNAIATARMAHLSVTNSQLIVGRDFAGNAEVDALIADPLYRNVLLYPGRDAVALEPLLEASDSSTAQPPPRFWVLDAKWSQVPQMLRLSPNLRALPMAKFSPDRRSGFQIRKQPRPDCLSTIEAMYLVIDRSQSLRQSQSTEHQALIDVFQYLVRQQLAFVNVELDMRHRAAKARRASRRGAQEASVERRSV